MANSIFETKSKVMEICLRLLTFNAPHSGFSDPPRFGDFQAHRHWMYLTNSLPIEEWYTWNKSHTYRNTTAEQWVLDYPPITAYAHKLYGANLPELYSDHGNQEDLLVVRMRFFILIIDIFLLILIYKCRAFSNARKLDISFLLCHPMLLLVDYIHYQPNNLMFFFYVGSIYLFAKSLHNVNFAILGTCSFIFCIASKQMALVYAPVIGLAYLSLCLKQSSLFLKLSLIIKLAFAVVFAISICILPFTVNYEDKWDGIYKQSLAILTRIFPIHRGLYEDKLGNFWCISDVMFKWRIRFDEAFLAKICTFVCLLFTLPVGLKVFSLVQRSRNPNFIFNQLFLSTCITSFIGFLFGYHVHEKTILLPIFSLLMYFMDKMSLTLDTTNYCIYKFLVVSSFNIFPLVVLDDSVHYFVALHLIWHAAYKPEILLIRNKTIIDVVYSPVLYSFLAILQAYPIVVVERYPFLFNLFIYAWCFVGNCVILAVLLNLQFRQKSEKDKVN